MKIGMILDNEFNSDVRVINEVNALTQAGYNVFVLCYDYGNKNLTKDFKDITIERILISENIKKKMKFLNNTIIDIYSIFWGFKVKNFAQKFNLDILHAHDLYMAKSVILANRSLKLKTVLDLHENYPATLESYSWTKTFLGKLFVNPKRWTDKEKKFLPEFSKIILLSELFKNVLMKKYPRLKDQFYVYQNYPDVKKLLSFEVHPNIINKKNEFIIFYFGGIAERRGIFTLFEALRILVKKSRLFKVLLIGPVDNADSKKLDSYLTDPELKENIIYYNWKDISLLPSYINISDVCISPIVKNAQHESGIANKVFQYMLFERPLIVSNCIPQEKVIEEEQCGLVFNSEDKNDLADKIEILYNKPEEREQMGRNGRKAVLEKYNLENSKRNLIGMYRTFEKV